MTGPRWVIHLPTTLTSYVAAVGLVAALRESLAHVDVLDFGEVTLSPEDDQGRRTRIWCDARLDGPGGRRCRRPARHPGACRDRQERHDPDRP
ncbi:hypothetical protein [Plantactinospora sonchi]|uniref:Uncharacterized protein n=1 Tax=Plantactinospora sonchi TaxID=1544735 RepID=A0ABU7RSA0_9ACTN